MSFDVILSDPGTVDHDLVAQGEGQGHQDTGLAHLVGGDLHRHVDALLEGGHPGDALLRQEGGHQEGGHPHHGGTEVLDVEGARRQGDATVRRQGDAIVRHLGDAAVHRRGGVVVLHLGGRHQLG